MKQKETPAQVELRRKRAEETNSFLEDMFGSPKTVLNYSNPLELLIAVILSAQCTDKMVNKVTADLFKKYKTLDDYCNATQEEFEVDIRSTGFYRNKTKNVLAMVQKLKKDFNGVVPNSIAKLITLPGVARKTANVVLGNVYGIYEGIAIDTHMKRLSNKYKLTDEASPDKIEQDLMVLLPNKEWFPFTYRLIEYGRTHSTAKKVETYDDPLSLELKKQNLL